MGGATGSGNGSGGVAGGDDGGSDGASAADAAVVVSGSDGASPTAAHLPLVLVSEVDLPGGATRFDYQDIDAARGYLVIAHMNDGAVLIVKLSDGSVVKQFPGIPVARGIAVADDVGRIFATSSPHSLVIIDNMTLMEISRVVTGNGPDGDGWDPVHKVIGVSDQSDGAISLIAGAGSGTRTQVPLGRTTGNVSFDSSRGWFWITVVAASPPDQLVAIDPVTATVIMRINLPGCSGAHGLRLHPDYQSAFIACETNYVLARVDLGATHAVVTAPTGSGPDVLSIDPGLGWLYIAAESGDLTVWDINKPGVALIGHDQPGANSHTIATDPSTHRVFFPLMAGPMGTPVLRIMKPSAT
jgi:hypothetical protein